MIKLGLVFTNDWELFGDGTGDYFEIQHHPLTSLAKVLEDHGAKLTIMAELAQHWAHLEISGKFSWAEEIATAWDSILMDMVRRGHDVQLHLHPQWFGAKHDGKEWRLDLNKWAITNLSYEEIYDALGKGKTYLETVLTPINPNYECVIFRSGAYCVQPSSQLFQGLVRKGFLADTSVTKGMIEPDLYDFRSAYSNFLPWFVNPGSIEKKAQAASGLIEIPIHSIPLWDSPFLRRSLGFFYGTFISQKEKMWFDERDRILNLRYPPKNRPFGRRFKPMDLVKALLRKAIVQLDYDRLPAGTFVKLLQQAIRHAQTLQPDYSGAIFPVVAVGHVKNMHNTDNIKRILDKLIPMLEDGLILYWTLKEATHYWSEMLVKRY